jgi:hypothetical protein
MIRLFSWKVSTNYVRSRHKPKKRLAFLFFGSRRKEFFILLLFLTKKVIFKPSSWAAKRRKCIRHQRGIPRRYWDVSPFPYFFLGGDYCYFLIVISIFIMYIALLLYIYSRVRRHRRVSWNSPCPTRVIASKRNSISSKLSITGKSLFYYSHLSFLYFPRPRKIEFPSLD